MARTMTITVDDPDIRPDGIAHLHATIDINLTLPTEADALTRLPRLLRGLDARLLNLWLIDDLADAAEYNRDDR